MTPKSETMFIADINEKPKRIYVTFGIH